LLSCLSCFYYIRLIKVLFFQSNGSNVQWIIVDHRLLEIAITSLCIILALFILTPNPLIAVSFGISELFLLT
jgi:NADH:ubiquinone oxidoreductase subunit 2 (subunit N)